MSLPEAERLPELMEVPGLPNRYPSILPIRIPHWPLWVWFIIGVVMVPILSIPVMGIARYTTTSSAYCITCHGTGETPDRSVRSLVHPDFNRVGCVECHALPGQIVFEGYMKGFMAEPERVSNNCVRCHEEITRRNDTQGFKFNFLNINIPHQFHLDKGAKCTTCHVNIAHDLNVPQTNRPTMTTCNTCHAQSDACNKCHSTAIPSSPAPIPAPASPGSAPDGRVLYMRVCSACHGQKGNAVAQANLSSIDFINAQGDAKLFKATSEGQGVMPAFSKQHGGPLTDDEIKAALGYLKVLAIRSAAAALDAQALYNANCIRCHGEDGDKVAGVRHSSKEFWYQKGEEQITKAIRNGKGGMPPFAKAQGGTLSDIEIEAIVEYLKSFPTKRSTNGAKAINAKDLYANNCAACHGDQGDKIASANLASTSFLSARSDEELLKAIVQGKGAMPGFGKVSGGPLSDDQVTGILDYIKFLAGSR